jgi:AcrR family transcriptional regulator
MSSVKQGRRRERLNREHILKAALQLAERDGLDALTMRRLGRELGVEAMALYYYFPSKEALLDGIVELLSERIEVPAGGADAWPDGIRRIMRSYRQVAHAHPETFPLLVLRPLATPVAVARAEAALDVLRRAGFDHRTAILAFRTLASYAGGFVLEELTGQAPRVTIGDREAEFEFGLDAVLNGLDAKRDVAGTS